MRIADLYLKLGLDGAGDVSKGLGKISGSLKELFSMSIQTKLTLAGIAAGLTGAAFSAGKTGANLNAFTKAFGLSSQSLQRWQQAAEGFNVSGEEMQGTIEALQNALAEARLGKGYNEVFTNLLIDPTKIKDGFELAETLRKRIQTSQVDAGRILSSGLIDQNVFQMMRQVGDPSKMKPVRAILSDAEIKAMQGISVGFTRFKENINRQVESFVVKNEPLIKKLLEKMEELLTVFLRWTSDLEKKSGLVSDISKGDSVPLAVTKAAGRGVLSYGDTINEAVIEGGKALWDSLKSGAMEIEAQKMLNEAKTTPKVDNSAGFVEIQKGNTSIFYIGNIDATDALSKNAKDEFTRLATHKIVSQGER